MIISSHTLIDNITGAITVLQPEGQERLCPDQTVVYQCHFSEGIFDLVWELPNGSEQLFFVGANNTNIKNSIDGKFSAVITERIPVNESELFMMTSTLTVRPPLHSLNGTRVECTGATPVQFIYRKLLLSLSVVRM